MWQVVSDIVTPPKALMVCGLSGGKGALVKREAHAGTCSPRKAPSASSSRRVPGSVKTSRVPSPSGRTSTALQREKPRRDVAFRGGDISFRSSDSARLAATALLPASKHWHCDSTTQQSLRVSLRGWRRPAMGRNLLDAARGQAASARRPSRHLSQARGLRRSARSSPFASSRAVPRPSAHDQTTIRRCTFSRDFAGLPLASSTGLGRASSKQARNNVNVIRTLFNHAYRDGLIPANPFANLGCVSRAAQGPRRAHAQELHALPAARLRVLRLRPTFRP